MKHAEAPSRIDPETELRAGKVGTLSGVLVVAWAFAFSVFFRDRMSAPTFWTILLSIGVLVVAVPALGVGRWARRRYWRGRGA
ncbi:MAG: hypothetical protein KDC38_02985 [Planctomycetes bacterium]|nr:hypothetical protein [Planctomycetota bacterium]